MKRPQRIILVLGIHRSGTSALTKGLETMHVALGDSLLPPNDFNEKGHWEDMELHDFNVQLLDFFGTSLRRILPLTEQEASVLCAHGFLEKASQLLREKLANVEPLGLKDPKFSLLLPFWKKVFEACHLRVSFVISLRNPWDVAASTRAAHQAFKEEQDERTFWTWITYLLSALEHSEKYERLLVDYEALLQHPSHQMHRVAAALALRIDPTRLQAYCEEFIDPALCHFHQEKKNSSTLPFHEQLALEIYTTLRTVAQDQETFDVVKKILPSWKKYFSDAQSLLFLAEKNELTMQQLEKTIQERDHTIYTLNKTINEKLNAIAGGCQTIHQRNLQLVFLAQEQAKQDQEILALTQQWEYQRYLQPL